MDESPRSAKRIIPLLLAKQGDPVTFSQQPVKVGQVTDPLQSRSSFWDGHPSYFHSWWGSPGPSPVCLDPVAYGICFLRISVCPIVTLLSLCLACTERGLSIFPGHKKLHQRIQHQDKAQCRKQGNIAKVFFSHEHDPIDDPQHKQADGGHIVTLMVALR
jgi:hypothetical protein